MLLEGKRLLITGVLTDGSIAFHTARVAQEQGAELVLTGFGRTMRLTERSAQRLPQQPDIVELTSIVPTTWRRWSRTWMRAGAPSMARFMQSPSLPPMPSGETSCLRPPKAPPPRFTTSAFSYKTLAVGLLPLFQKAGGGSLVTLDFDNSTQAWPGYDWMGVSKAALVSVTRYLARDLGPSNVRVNAVSAGPLTTVAAKGIAGFSDFIDVWNDRSPLAWDAGDPEPVANMICVMLSDFATKTSGEVIRVDGGFHAIAAGSGSD